MYVKTVCTSFGEIYNFSAPLVHFHVTRSCRSIIIMVFTGQLHELSIIILFVWSVMQVTSISLHYRCHKKKQCTPPVHLNLYYMYMFLCVMTLCIIISTVQQISNIFSQLGNPWKEVSKGSLVVWQKSWIFLPNLAFSIRKVILSSVPTVRFS